MNFQDNIPLTYILYFAGIFIFSVLINSILLRLAKTLGIRNNSEMQTARWSPTVKPALGGISFFMIFLFSFLFIGLSLGNFSSYLSDKKLLGFLYTVTLAFLMGLADDAFDTRPLLKFSTQLICALILIATGTHMKCFQSDFVNYLLTVLWVVGLMNSINMLDNMDGITTLVSMVMITFFISEKLYINEGLNPQAFLCLSVLGALAGFLIFNFHPSKMFMGDTGSQFLGVFLAIMGIEFCWNVPVINSVNLPVHFPVKNLVLVALVFILPLTDTTTVFINRLAKGKSPFIGGKDHTTHHLFFKGITEKRIAILFVFIGSVACLLAHYVSASTSLNMYDYIIYLSFPLPVFLFLFLNTRIRKKVK
ncbi:MAG: undecaprenyl/decaprenyl-phosphate alpha-N-acetylglucosaminyl 1-phosphate transferase [Bacteroidia bacterium]|nr:undecaprenyl/decaprenyl-phosphate alpha-N-acetylglucosaminyl 1-phosphate transferase [Bacteroidia bacterium]